MNISHKDLTAAYRSFLRSRRPASRKDCPEIEELWKLFDRRTRERTKSKLLGHIGQCSFCSEDFLSLLEIRRATADLEFEIGHWRDLDIPLKEACDQRLSNTIAGRKRWQFAFLAAGSFIIAAALFIFFLSVPFSPRIPDRIRDHPQIGIALLQPTPGAVLRKGELRFRWEKTGSIDAYVLEMFDSSLARIWRSGILLESDQAPPPEILATLLKGKRYFWMVTGYDQNGKTIESALSGFLILD